MKPVFLFLSLLVLSTAFGQDYFQNLSFNEALQKAKAEGRLIFIQFESAECNQCNEVAEKGLSDKSLSEQMQQTFICLKINAQHPNRQQIGLRYNIQKGYGSLFIDENGTLVHRYNRTTTRADDYKKQIDLALTAASENLKVSQLEKEYQAGNRNTDFLELLIAKKKTLGLPTDSLLDEYTTLLPPDSLKSIRTIQFMVQMIPLINSKAYLAVHANRQIHDSAWFQLDNAFRVSINNLTVRKSLYKAILEKNEAYAMQVADFAQGTYNRYYTTMEGIRYRDKTMLQFYERTADTSKYFIKAIAYYDRYLMNVNPDSIKRLDSIRMLNLVKSQKPKIDTVYKDNKIIKTVQRVTITSAPMVQGFMAELNEGAWNFYKFTNNPYLLSLATEWIKRGLEFYQSPEALDTYARLLYKQNQKEKAIEIQTKAAALNEKQHYPSKELIEVLEKMKKGVKLLD